MPCTIRQLTPDGLIPVDYTAESLKEAGDYEPDDGVYTVSNTYQTDHVLKLDAHLDRLEQSAARAGIPFELDQVRLRSALREMILQAGYGSVRFRVTVPRQQPDHLILSIEPYNPPSAELIQKGVRAITAPNSARHNPTVKATGWMHQRKAIEARLGPDAYDAFLLSAEGHLLEGLGSNFYAIKEGVLRTAREGVLMGISRQIVMAVAPEILPVDETPVHVDDIPQLDEAFLTSSSRGIIPVVAIDGITIGDGTPGPKTRALRAAYQSWVNAHLEPL